MNDTLHALCLTVGVICSAYGVVMRATEPRSDRGLQWFGMALIVLGGVALGSFAGAAL